MKSLNAKQQRFVQEYLVDLNATQAAIRAGYSEKTARSIASELLTKPDIQAAVTDGKQKISQKTGLSVQWVLERLSSVAERCLQCEQVLDRKGDPVYVETPNGEEAVAFTFQAGAANRALELLGKHLGMFVEKVEHTGKDGGPIQTEDISETERARRIAFVLTKATRETVQ